MMNSVIKTHIGLFRFLFYLMSILIHYSKKVSISLHFFLINLFIYLFIFGCLGSSLLCAGFSLVAASRGYSSLRCAGFSLQWLLLLRSIGSRCTGFSSCGSWAQQLWLGLQSAGSVVVVYGLSCSAACGIFPDQGLNPCPLHWQVDS